MAKSTTPQRLGNYFASSGGTYTAQNLVINDPYNGLRSVTHIEIVPNITSS